MSWLLLGLFSAIFFALIGLTDKFVINRYFNNSWSYPFFTSFFFGLFCSLILIFRIQTGQFHSPSIGVTLLALMPGFALLLSGVLYTKALINIDASIMFGITQINPIFAIFWGWLYFGEIYQPLNYIGIVIIVACAILLSLERTPGFENKFHLSESLIIVVIATLFRSLSDLFIKVALTDLAYWDAFALSRIGLLMAAIILFNIPAVRKQIMHPIREHGKKMIFIVGFIEFLALLNSMIIVLAFSLGPLALVSTTQTMVPIFMLVFTLVINYFKPGLIPEKRYAISNLSKALLGSAIIGGVFFIYQFH
jgi:drug/metabolite transporter (DMT)-like permease